MATAAVPGAVDYATRTELHHTNERTARIEATLEHLANKSDLAELRAELSKLETRLIRWLVGAVLGGMATAAAITVAIQRLLGS